MFSNQWQLNMDEGTPITFLLAFLPGLPRVTSQPAARPEARGSFILDSSLLLLYSLLLLPCWSLCFFFLECVPSLFEGNLQIFLPWSLSCYTPLEILPFRSSPSFSGSTSCLSTLCSHTASLTYLSTQWVSLQMRLIVLIFELWISVILFSATSLSFLYKSTRVFLL